MECAQIPILTPTNWSVWKTDMKVLLMHWGCWRFIEGTESPIIKKGVTDGKTAGKSSTSETGPATEGATWREVSDWQMRKDRAFTFIYQGLRPDLRSLLSGTTDGREAWKILTDHFEPRTRAQVVRLLDEFFMMRFKPNEDFGLFISRVKEAAGRLKAAGHELQPLYVGFQLIRSLPQEYQPAVQQIYRWSDEEFHPDKIEAELILEQNRLQLMEQDFQ